MSRSERLGVFGGSFNPVHVAHLLLAQEAYYRFDLSRVIFVPAARNPLKEAQPEGATSEQRLQMLHLACDPDARFSVDAFDLRRPGPTYMVDTLRRLTRVHPGADLYLITGSDCACSFNEWKAMDEIGKLARIVVADRPGSDSFAQGLPPELAALELRWEFMPLPPMEISSTEIRARVRRNKPVRYFVPDTVAEFIHERKLYSGED